MQRSAKLVDEETYLTAQSAMSQKQFQYFTAFPPVIGVKQFPRKCTPYAGGCKQGNVTGESIDALNYAAATRPNPRPNTELFGVAPFRGRGDGILRNPDVYSNLISSGFNPHCAKSLSEVDYDRFECMGAPMVVEDERITGPRGGASTRVGPAYYACY